MHLVHETHSLSLSHLIIGHSWNDASEPIDEIKDSVRPWVVGKPYIKVLLEAHGEEGAYVHVGGVVRTSLVRRCELL